MATVDVPGAYLNARMPDDTRVRMRLNAFLTDVVVQLDPSYSDYVGTDVKSVVELDKALYGLKNRLCYGINCCATNSKPVGLRRIDMRNVCSIVWRLMVANRVCACM